MESLEDLIQAWVTNKDLNIYYQKYKIYRETFLGLISKINIPFKEIYSPGNDINFYEYRFHFGKCIHSIEISNKTLEIYKNQNIPLVFPHLLISSWTPYYFIFWERYDWKGRKFRHLPELTIESKDNKYEEDFITEIIRVSDSTKMIKFPLKEDRIIENSGPLFPWFEEKNLKISEILFQAGISINNLMVAQ
ncbi:MAG: hypothetical protein KDK36_01835 [Leptospiraceae bacterium]|nr:hypothetical protein [Leptospiraceae bacterium]